MLRRTLKNNLAKLPLNQQAALQDARRRAGGAAIRGMFEGLSQLAKRHPHADPARHNIEVIRDVPYALTGRQEHLLDIYKPAGEGPFPTLMYVHGGGFRILSKDTHWIMGLGFAKRGFIVFNINYRLAPQHPFPAASQDVSQAYLWLLQNGQRFGADLDTLVLAGESAGGNLVTSLTLSTCWRRPEPWASEVFDAGRVPDAVIAACGYMQLSDPGRYDRRKPLPKLLSDRIHETSRGYIGQAHMEAYSDEIALADVLPFFKAQQEAEQRPERPLPPFFLPCGTRDPILDDTRQTTRALKALGADAREKIYPGEVHAFHAFVWRKKAQQCWRDMYQFLEDTVQAP